MGRIDRTWLMLRPEVSQNLVLLREAVAIGIHPPVGDDTQHLRSTGWLADVT